MKARGTLPSIGVSILAFLLAFGLAASPALAQTTVIATASSGGNWTSTSPAPIWSCSPTVSPCIPDNNPGDIFNVVINGGSVGSYTGPVAIDSTSTPSAITVNSLLVTGPYADSGNPVTVSEIGIALSVANGASLTVGGTFTDVGAEAKVGAGSVVTANTFGNLSSGTLSGGLYNVGGTFQYGGGAANIITSIANATAVDLDAENGGAALMTPNGTTNALSTITTNNGLLELDNGASLSLASLTGPAGLFTLNNTIGAGGGSTLNVSGNYDQGGTYIFGSGNALTVSGTMTNDGGEWEVGAGSTITADAFSNLSGGTLSSGRYDIGGTFTYGGGSGNTITTIAGGAVVSLEGGDGGAALMTPDGTTNALSTLATNNGELNLYSGAGVNATNTLASLTGSTGELNLINLGVPGASGALLNVTGNYDQQTTRLFGSGNTLTVGGTFTNDGGAVGVAADSTITVAKGLTNLSNAGELSTGRYEIGGTFHYGGSNTITTIGSGVSVTLDAYNDIPGGKAGEALMTPDGTTNALSTLTTNNGYLALEDGASVGNALASLTGLTGTLQLYTTSGPPFVGTTLTVTGNYDQNNTYITGPGNTLTVGGTFTNDDGTVYVAEDSTITVAKGLTNLSNAGELSTGAYEIGGTFHYGGSNTITTIGSGVSVTLDAYNDIPGGKAGEALMTPDGTTNALSTLTTNNGYLALEDGASVGATLASFTGSTGSLTLHVVEPGGSGSTLNVGGNYDQFNTTLLGTGNALTIGGTFTSDGGTSEVDAGSTITVAGRYSQTSGTTEVNGTLMSPTVNIDGGTLSGTGTVQGAVLIVGGATVSPGDPGTMTINGSLDLGSGSTLTLEISGASDYDSLDIIGNGTFDGNVDLDFLNGFAPVSGDTFGFITDTGGTFSWNPSNISFLGVLMPGTYTINLVGGFSLTATSNWVPEPPPAQTPEPASFLLLGTGFLFLLGYSLRRRIRRASGSGSGK